MPQVPLLSPTTPVQTDPIPQANIPVSSDAFGGMVGQALQGLGKDVEGAGDRIWQRAIEMQDLQNRTEVDKSDAEYMKQAGLLHADFSAKQGDEAKAAFPKYIQDLQDARMKIRDGLSNPAVQRMYDSQTLSTMGRTIFNGAGHAAEQTKVAAIQGLESRRQAVIDTAATTDDPAQIEQAKTKAAALTHLIYDQKGIKDPDSVNEGVKTVNSSLDFNVIKHTAKTDPWAAEKMLNDRKSGMTAQDYDRAADMVLAQKRSIGSVNIATDVLNDNKDETGKPEKSLDELETQVKEKAGDDPVLAQHAVSALHSLWNQKRYADRQFKYDNMQTIDEAIQNGAGDIQQLNADPKVAAAIQNLPPGDQLRIPARINNYIAARDRAVNERSLTTIMGLRNEDQESFLNLDPSDPKYKLSQPQIRTVMGWQAQDKKRTNDDPRVMRAMGWLRGAMGAQLNTQGVYSMPGASKGEDARNDYLHFVGSLQSALDLWSENHNNKPPGYEDVIGKIGPQLLQTRYKPGWFGSSVGSDQVPFFKQDIPEDFTTGYKANVNPQASDEEIYKGYVRAQLMKLYKKQPTDAK